MSRNQSLVVACAVVGFTSLLGAQVLSPPQNLRVLSATDPVYPVPPAGHEYFNSMAARPEVVAVYSLRDAAQLALYKNSNGKPQNVTYDPSHDPDPRRQDAAKVVVPATSVSLPNQVRLPIPAVAPQSLLVTWDSWLGAEFSFARTQISRYKHFQFASPKDVIFTEVRSDFQQASNKQPDAVAFVDMRSYGQLGSTLGPNVTNNLPLSPQVGSFAIMPERWTRYWAYFNPAGEWHEFSLWMADETRDPVLIFDRLQVKPNGGLAGWESFWLEYNTSSYGVPEGRGELVAYARNVVMLKGVASPASLLARPVP